MDRNSFGTSDCSVIDNLGTWLSRRMIRRCTGTRHDLNILEIGCGYKARNLIALEDRAAKMVGCDFNIDPELKKSEKFEAIELAFEDALPVLQKRSFDLIMLISVLEHLSDPLATLKACHQMLGPKGILLINVPTWLGKYFLELTAFRLGLSANGRIEMDEHKMYYDKRDLWPLLVKADFLPSQIHLKYHKFGLCLFAVVDKP